MHYDSNLYLVGGKVLYQLLEVDRVSKTSKNEFNFNIFYELLLNAPQNLKENVKLSENVEYAVSFYEAGKFCL